MTKEGLEASMQQFGSNIGSDMERFGAPQLQAPYEVFLTTVEDRGGMTGSMIGYGHGDVGNEMAKVKFDVPMACDLRTRD